MESVQESWGIWTPTLVAEGDEAEHAGIALNPRVHMEASKFQMRFATLCLRKNTAPKKCRNDSFGVGVPDRGAARPAPAPPRCARPPAARRGAGGAGCGRAACSAWPCLPSSNDFLSVNSSFALTWLIRNPSREPPSLLWGDKAAARLRLDLPERGGGSRGEAPPGAGLSPPSRARTPQPHLRGESGARKPQRRAAGSPRQLRVAARLRALLLASSERIRSSNAPLRPANLWIRFASAYPARGN